MRPLKRFFPHFGSKVAVACQYPQPKHMTIVEPFAGAAGYATRYHDRKVILIEKNPRIAEIWRWLIAARPEDILRLPIMKAGDHVDNYTLSPVERDFLGKWIGMTRRDFDLRVARGDGVGFPASIRLRTAWQVQRIKHWRIINADCNAVDIESFGPATYFVDPPYENIDVAYGKSKGLSREAIDFDALARRCKALPGQVIVCEKDGATWLPFRPFTSTGNTENKRRSYEAIWTKDC